eukprot:gene48500-26340_t
MVLWPWEPSAATPPAECVSRLLEFAVRSPLPAALYAALGYESGLAAPAQRGAPQRAVGTRGNWGVWYDILALPKERRERRRPP